MLDDVVDLQPVVQTFLKCRQPPSLHQACSTLLRRALDKSQQCSDWCTRPLSKEQIRYAASDAYVLLSLRGRLEKLQEAVSGIPPASPLPLLREMFVPDPEPVNTTGGFRSCTAMGRWVPTSYAEEYEDYEPIELKDNAAPAADWVSRLYTDGSVANGTERLKAMKPHPGGNQHVVFVPRGDVQELYAASKQPEFCQDLRKSRQGARRRPRLVFPPFVPSGL